MPRYRNNYSKYIGYDNLSIPPRSTNYGSIYYYNMPELIDVDSEPQYNPIKQKQYDYINNSSGGSDITIMIDLDQDLILKDFFIHITSRKISCVNDRLDNIELYFNSLDNVPSLFLDNSMFCINNSNRIKKLFFIIKAGVECEILAMISDKFLIGHPTVGYGSSASSWKV